MKKISIVSVLVVLLLSVVLSVSGQTYSGKVTGKGAALSGVSVTLMDENHTAIKFAKTDKQGMFSIGTPEGKEAAFLQFVFLGYEKRTIPTTDFRQSQTIALEEKFIEIKEVEVTAQKIIEKGDTLIYNVRSFREQQDRTIEDVIARMPGLEVMEDGTILFQGIPINKFYVDGEDISDDKYALVTRNLSAGKVRSVEVWRNHQPVKTLRGMKFSEQAALNLVLTDDAKGSWQGTLDLGTGAGLQSSGTWLRQVRLTGMYFGKRWQNISIYKHDNTGQDILAEITSKQLQTSVESGVLQKISYSAPSVQERRRSTFNDSHVAASNWLLRTGSNSNLRLQLSGYYDNTRGETTQIVQYHDIEGKTLVSESSRSTSRERRLDVASCYTYNSQTCFLQNKLGASAYFDESEALTMLNGRSTQQHVKPGKRSVADELTFVTSPKKRYSLTLFSTLSHQYLPGELLLYDGRKEVLDIHTFSWVTDAALSFRREHVVWSLPLRTEVERKQEDVAYSDTTGRAVYKVFNLLAGPSVSLRWPHFSATMAVKAKWVNRTMGNVSEHRLAVEPSASFLWRWERTMQLNGNYSTSTSPDNFYVVSPLRVYTNYRVASLGRGMLNHTSRRQGQLVFALLTLPQSMDLHVNYNYNYDDMGELYNSRLVNGYYSQTATGERNVHTSHQGSLTVGKGFPWWKLHLKLSGGYGLSGSNFLMDGYRRHIALQHYSASLSYDFSPWHSLKVEGVSEWRRSVNDNKQSLRRSNEYMRHRLTAVLTQGKWLAQWSNSWSYSSVSSLSNRLFSDVSVSYRTQSYEVSLLCTNLLGYDSVDWSYFNASASYVTSYAIRPREILVKLSLNL